MDSKNNYPLATRKKRLLAFLIDNLIISIIMSIILILVFPDQIDYLANKLTNLENQTLNTIDIFKINAIFMILYILVNLKLLHDNGQTIGKKLLKIKIVKNNNSLLSVEKIILFRIIPFWLVQFIPLFGSFLYLLDFFFIFNKNHKCLHDIVAGTKVVDISNTL